MQPNAITPSGHWYFREFFFFFQGEGEEAYPNTGSRWEKSCKWTCIPNKKLCCMVSVVV